MPSSLSNEVADPFMPNGYQNAFGDVTTESKLSQVGQSFIAGILAHAPALEALCSPTAACKLRHGRWAPTCGNWGSLNRTACVRVKAGDDTNTAYCEMRMPSSAANAHLVMAGIVAAGLDGLNRSLSLPPEMDSASITLPENLREALSALKSDSYLVEKLGQPFIQWYETVKLGELTEIDVRMKERELNEDSAWREIYLEYL